MKVVSALALAGLFLLGATDRGAARVQAQMYCWDADSEFPVACEQEDEDDEASGFRLPASGATALPVPSLKPQP